MEGPAVHQCQPSRRCRCIQRGRLGPGVSSARAVHVAAAAEWVGVTPEHFAHARPPLRTPRISGRSRCGGHSARWDVPRPRAAHSGYFEGSRPRSQRGGWRRPASSSAACTGPSRYSTHKVGLEDMGGPDPPAGWAARFRSAPQLAGCQGSGPPSRRLELWRATPAPQTRPPYRPWSCIARQREQPPREAGCQQVHVHRAGRKLRRLVRPDRPAGKRCAGKTCKKVIRRCVTRN